LALPEGKTAGNNCRRSDAMVVPDLLIARKMSRDAAIGLTVSPCSPVLWRRFVPIGMM
jgi:hypothetical protein